VDGIVHSVAMKAAVRNLRDSRLTVRPATAGKLGSSVRSVRISQLCRMCECEQVAAVCYRIRNGAIEFLLVQTRGSGRWTFPKGSAEPGLSHAQAAAIEAFEEAGVHGRIEEASFTRYFSRKHRASGSSASSSPKGLAVSAHLCQVLRLSKPKESNRNRTWFSVEDTKQHLREGRKKGDADEFARMVQHAVARIRQLSRESEPVVDRLRAESLRESAIQKVRLEAVTPPYDRWEQDSLAPYLLHRLAETRRFTTPADDADCRETLPRDVLPFVASQQLNQSPRLLSGPKKMKALGTGAKSD